MVECSICLDKLDKSKDISITSCKHSFHTSCLLKWICNNRGCCPLCRTTLLDIKEAPEPEPSPEPLARRYDVLERILDDPQLIQGYEGEDAFWAAN